MMEESKILNDLKYKYCDKPKCPHCDNEDEDWWEYAEQDMDETRQCMNCGKEYRLQCEFSPSFSTSKELEE